MAAKRHQRTAARRAALALLYTSEITEEYATTIADEGRALEEAGPLTDYAKQLVRGVESHIAAIDKEIAATAYMGEGTVRNHISSILAKMGLRNRTQIAIAYLRG